MLHVKSAIPFSSLKNIPHGTGTGGEDWREVRHDHLLSTIICEAQDRKWRVTDIRIATSNAGDALAASLDLLTPRQQKVNLGVCNSNNICCRGFALVGLEGIPLLQPDWKLRHTKYGNLDEDVQNLFSLITDSVTPLKEEKQWLQKQQITEPLLAQITIAASQRRVTQLCGGACPLMPWSRLGRVVENFHDQSDRSAWSLLRTFAEVATLNPPLEQMQQIFGFLQLLKGTLP